MTDESQELEPLLPDSKNLSKIIVGVSVAVIVLTVLTVGAYQYAKKRTSAVVLPGGTTYLGPSEAPKSPPPPPVPAKFTADASVPLVEYKGKVYPFTFSYPQTLTLIPFQGDPTDSVGISWNNIPPQQNILIRVSDINKVESSMTEYINKPKIEYARNWWKQYTGGLKGVKSVEPFTNSKGMQGYKAKYINHANQTPNDDVFFEIPGRAELMVRFGNGPLDASVFNTIIDTFAWGKTAAQPTVSEIQTTPTQ